MSRRVKWIGIGVAAVVLILCIAILTVYLKPNSVAGTPQNVVFTVDKDQTGAEIGDMLYEKGIISSPTTFRMALRLTGLMDKLQQGYYQIPQNASLRQVISLLQKGKVQSIKVTIPEGYTIQQIAVELEEDGLGPKEAFLEVAKTYVPYQYMYGPAQVDYRVEGFLFPSTYEIPVGSTPQEILKRMAGEMNKQLTPAIREQIAAKHMTIFEFITLASLVEREALFDEDRPIIAAVFLKRLQIGMPLQSCASIQYILGYPKSHLSIEDTQIPSPYNTYIHAGLPPGPIANPGMKSMEAVLNAPSTDYLFFVADKEGHHHFTKTYAEHLKVVESIYGE